MFNYDAEDWDLFENLKGVEACAERLNKQLAQEILAVSKQIGRSPMHTLAKQARDNMFAVMRENQNARFGASDTEPQWAVVDFINKALGTDISRWD